MNFTITVRAKLASEKPIITAVVQDHGDDQKSPQVLQITIFTAIYDTINQSIKTLI